MKHLFKIILLEEAAEFIDQLDEKTKYKQIYNLNKAQIAPNVTLFKKLRKEIWEFRTYYNTTYYRLFAFWDKCNKSETLVITTHGLIKNYKNHCS